MAKKSRLAPQVAPKMESVEPKPPRFERPTVETVGDLFLKKIFWGMAAVALVAMLWAAAGVGINADDKFQNDYSKKLVNYYGTFGRDTSALFVKDGNMHLYGGFFDATTGFANKALGFQETEVAYHNVRHFFSAILGWLAIVFAGFFTARVAGWRAACLTMFLAFLSPHFFGHALMNPKDIPFAAGYIIALYNMVCALDGLPRPRWQNLVGLGLGLALALATRAGGLLLFAYLGLFGGLHLMMKNGLSAAFSIKNSSPYLKFIIPTAIGGWLVACLFWPFAMQSPFKNPLAALAKFSDLEVHIRVLFGGENVMSDQTPWQYPLTWIWKTIPLGVLFGLMGSVIFLPRLLKKYAPIWVLLAGFAAIFPVFYVVYKNSVLHDGWRHLTFAYLPMVVCAAIFWESLWQFFEEKKKAFGWAVAGLVGLLSLDSMSYLLQNPRLAYCYFNPLAGGVSGQFGNMETDYWGISTRQGLDWLESQGILSEKMDSQIVIATNMYYPVKMLVGKYGDKVKISYQKWENRCNVAWDYALYPTRFIDGSQLRQPTGFPPKNAVHVIKAGGAPILAILKNDNSDCYQGIEFSKKGDWNGAISSLSKEVEKVPNSELAWASLGQALLNNRQLDSASWAAKKCLEIAPDHTQAINLTGLVLMQKGEFAAASKHFEAATRRDASNAGAWYYLAMIKANQNDNQSALKALQKCIEQAPNFKPAIELAAQIYQKMGNTAQAEQLLKSLGK